MGDLREPGGGAAAAVESPLESLSTSITSNSSPPPSIGPESWGRAEKAIQKIILKVQPTKLSEERRKEVIEYVQRLMKSCNGCEVFPYGSVPLKTYLPDGDIDLTAFGGTTSEEELAEDIVSALGGEEQNKAAEFVVKDVQLIRAEVKLVKCIIQNIVVDISFNQIGGLCTLCFLEKVDRLIGKDHLFKRSIILIKAWCYYESRILGAHHGLISTYALETLVLYIFHLFHSSLNGPLSVLYKFLDYFSQFDWENYCISLSGPVRLSSLPEFVVETPDNGGGNLLLTSEFLGYCAETYSAVPSRGVDLNSRTFQQKFLNIVDPLKENNNLGRSISKGNFFRIRSAFTYGARKLGQILMEPQDDIDEGLSKFFFNMLGRHGSGQRPDVLQVPPHGSSNNGFGPALVVSKADSCPTENVIPETESMSYTGTSKNCRSGSKASSHNAISYMKVSGGENHIKNNEVRDGYAKLLPHNMFHKADRNAMGKALDDRIFGDAKDLATSRFESLQISSGFSEYPDFAQESAVPVARPYYIPHLYFSNPMLSDGDKGTNNSHRVQIENSQNNRYSGGSRWSDRDHGFGLEKDIISREDDIVVPAEFKDVHLAKSKVLLPENFYHGNLGSATPSARTPESLNPVADLCGDYEAHYNSLLYGRASTQYAVGTSSRPINAAPASVFQMQNSLDGAQQQYQFVQNGFSHVSMHGVVSSPAFYMANQILIPGVAFGLEEMPKPRGTGTYLPNMNRPLLGYRPPSARGRNQAPSRSPRNNNRNVGFMDNNVTDRGSHEVSYDQSGPKSGTSDINPSFSPRGKVNPNANAFVLQSHGGFEHSSAGHATEAPLFERRKQRHQKSQSITSPPQNSSPVSSPSGMERSKPVLSRDYDRFSMKSSYRLKDDDDFPPLSL